jgi:lysophospholipase L1-like esterase
MWWRAATIVATSVAMSAIGTVTPVLAGGGPVDRQIVAVTPPIPPGIPPAPVIESTSSLGRMNDLAQIRGHDKGQSSLYDRSAQGGPKFSYWSFGDTGVDFTPGGFRIIGNTALRTTDLTMSDNLTSFTYDNEDPGDRDPHETYPKPSSDCVPAVDCVVWGGSTVADPANRRMIAIVHVIRAQRNGGAPYNYYGVATWAESTNTWTVQPVAHPSDIQRPDQLWADPGADAVAFNTGMVIKDGYLYAYGCWGSNFECRLARVPTTPVSAVYDRAAWRFYTAGGTESCPADIWSDDANCAGALPAGAGRMRGGSAGASVAWNPYLNKYMEIYARPSNNGVHMAVADRLEGPWSASTLIANGALSPVLSEGRRPYNYAAYGHAEYAEQNGKIQYITYIRNMCLTPPVPGTTCPSSGLAGRQEFDIMRVDLGTSPARYQRAAGGESYFADSAGSLRINATGPTSVDASGSVGELWQTLDTDRHGTIFSRGVGQVGTTVVTRVFAQTSTDNRSIAGLVMRNRIDLPHAGLLPAGGRGYVTVVAAPGGGVSMRYDADGDHDLDTVVGAANTVNAPIWLRLARTGVATYQGAYSSSGADGTWTVLGSVTLPGAAAPTTTQDVGMFAAGPTESAFNRATFTNFEVRPGIIGTVGTAVSRPADNATVPTYCPPPQPGGTLLPGFFNHTVRNILHTSIGSTSSPSIVRVKVSNLGGTSALPLTRASIGLPTAGGAALSAEPLGLTFDNGVGHPADTGTSIASGAEKWSNPVLVPSDLVDKDVAVSLYFSGCSGRPSWHPNAQMPSPTTGGSFTFTGDQTAAAVPPTPLLHENRWYFGNDVDIANGQALGTVVTLGDSLTDGCCTTAGNRWPDKLADRLIAAGPALGVVNKGNSGDHLANVATGDLVRRFDNDVLATPGVRTVIVALGVNDLADKTTPPTAAQMIGYYRILAAEARANGVRMLIATITPLGVHTTLAAEQVRQDVNTHLRAAKEFDGYIDFDEFIKADDPTRIRDAYASGDGSLHCNAAGYAEIARRIDLTVLNQPARTQ